MLDSLRSILPTAAVLTVIVGGYLAFGHRAAVAKQDRITAEIESAGLAAESLPVRLAELASLKRQVARRETFLASVNPMLSDEVARSLLHRIGAIAANHRLTDVRTQPLPTRPALTYEQRSYQVRFQGAGSDAIALVGELERPPLAVDVQTIDLVRSGRGSSATVDGTLTFSVYVGVDPS